MIIVPQYSHSDKAIPSFIPMKYRFIRKKSKKMVIYQRFYALARNLEPFHAIAL